MTALVVAPAGAGASQDYPGITQFVQAPTGSYETANRPTDLFIKYVIIHDTEGNYPASFAVLTAPGACCSVHYLVDGQSGASYPAVTQFVHDADIAYHAGNFWFNQHAIGIEHDGFADGPVGFYTETMYERSARLAGWLAATYHIPIDRAHFLSHANLPGPAQAYTHGMHWDPGPFWDWPRYLNLVRAAYTHWTHEAVFPMPDVPLRFRADRPVIRTIAAGTRYSSRGDVTDWSSGRHTEFANVYSSPGGGLVLGASNASTWTSPTVYNQRDFICDNLPDVTSANGMDQLSDQRAKADWGEAFVRIGTARRHGIRYDHIWFNGVKGWVRDGQTKAGWGVIVRLKSPGTLYGKPILDPAYEICPLPTDRAGQSYVSQDVYRDGNGTTWYEIYYNHRVAWVPASEVSIR